MDDFCRDPVCLVPEMALQKQMHARMQKGRLTDMHVPWKALLRADSLGRGGLAFILIHQQASSI